MPSTSLAIVLGSATPPGRLHRAVGLAATRAGDRHADLTTVTFDLAELTIPYADGRPATGDTATVIDVLTTADAVLFATPVYRGSLTGVLKNLLDHVPVEALRDTATGIASMGASDHHFLGVERHLRDILAFFGTLTAPTAAYLTSRDFADGEPTEDALNRLDALIDTLLLLSAHAGDAPLGPPPLGAGRG
jgi:FMN reductase